MCFASQLRAAMAAVFAGGLLGQEPTRTHQRRGSSVAVPRRPRMQRADGSQLSGRRLAGGAGLDEVAQVAVRSRLCLANSEGRTSEDERACCRGYDRAQKHLSGFHALPSHCRCPEGLQIPRREIFRPLFRAVKPRHEEGRPQAALFIVPGRLRPSAVRRRPALLLQGPSSRCPASASPRRACGLQLLAGPTQVGTRDRGLDLEVHDLVARHALVDVPAALAVVVAAQDAEVRRRRTACWFASSRTTSRHGQVAVGERRRERGRAGSRRSGS